MKRIILAILMVLLIVTPIGGQQIPFESIQPIAQVVYAEDGTAYFANVCTASSINQKEHYWLTAYHCVADEGPHYIAGQPVTYVMKDVPNDLAIVATPVLAAPALKLASKAPITRDSIMVIGHPWGQIFPVVTIGTVAAEKILIEDTGYFMFLQVPSAPGGSGSPVLNEKNEIVSVVQRGTSRSWGPVLAGALFEKVAALGLWFEK